MVAISSVIPRARAAVTWEELWVYDEPIYEDMPYQDEIEVSKKDADGTTIKETKVVTLIERIEVLPGHIWIAEVTQEELKQHLRTKSRWIANTNKWVRGSVVAAAFALPLIMFSPLPFILKPVALQITGIMFAIAVATGLIGWFVSKAFMGKPMTIVRRRWDFANKAWVTTGYVQTDTHKEDLAKEVIAQIGAKKAAQIGIDEKSHMVSSAATLHELLEAKDERGVLQGPGDKMAKTLQFIALAIVALSVFGLFVLYALAQKGQS